MRLQRFSNGNVLTLNPSDTMGAGGEAFVFPVPPAPDLVAKVYRRPAPEHAAKLQAMLANPPADPMAAQGHISIAWPIDLLVLPDASRRVVGFLMPRATGQHPLLDFYNPTARRKQCPLFNYQYLLRTARNLAAAIRAVHARGYVIGDVNEMNLLVTDTALLTLVDTDSFQVRDPHSGAVYRCPVGRPEFTPPELQNRTFRDIDRTPEHDLFGLAVLLFQLLMEGTHPFAGVFTEDDDPPPYEARILRGQFPYGTRPVPFRPMPSAPPLDLLAPPLRALFLRCFEEGHQSPQLRPDAETWVAALQDAEGALTACAVNDQHRYGNHLGACPWCARAARLGGRDPFPSKDAVQAGRPSAATAPVQAPLPAVTRPVAPHAPPPAPRLPIAPPAASAVPPPVPPIDGYTPAEPDKPEQSIWVPAGIGAVAVVLLVSGLMYAAHSRQPHSAGPPGATGAAVAAPNSGSLSATTASRPNREQSHQESETATAILDTVRIAIDRFKNGNFTEAQAEEVRRALREDCNKALTHADMAIQLDSTNEDGWLARVRALRLSGNTREARAAVRLALQQFPTNSDLREQDRLLGGR